MLFVSKQPQANYEKTATLRPLERTIWRPSIGVHKHLTKFWNMRVHLPVCALGFHTILHLLSTDQRLHQVGFHDHFFARCPIRWGIWTKISVANFPHYYFTPMKVIDILHLTVLPTPLISSASLLLIFVFTSH